MSRYETDVVLYRLKKDSAFRDRFKSNPGQALADADLSDEERDAFVRWDARKLNELGGSLHLLVSIPGLSSHYRRLKKAPPLELAEGHGNSGARRANGGRHAAYYTHQEREADAHRQQIGRDPEREGQVREGLPVDRAGREAVQGQHDRAAEQTAHQRDAE